MRTRSVRIVLVAGLFSLAAGSFPGCNCSNGGRTGGNGGSGGTGGGGNGDMGVPLTGTISISPTDVTLDLVQGQPPQSQAFTVTLHAPSGDVDVSGSSSFILADTTLGSMNQNTFTTGTAHGGTTLLTATYMSAGMPAQAQAMIHVRVKGTFPGPDCGAGCGTFPPDTAPNCSAPNLAATIVYPTDGVLLPPNMSVISIHWTPFPGTPPTVQLYEVDFANANTDVRITTKCAMQTVDTGGTPSGGCELQLDQNMWDFIAKSNRGGDGVKVTVRASSDGTCATKSTNSVNMAFAEQDVNGGIYYWKSTISASGTGGQIWAKAFGNSIPEAQITGQGGLGGSCYGCHSLSRDGKYMTVNQDDSDSDDEYTDMNHSLVDVKAKMQIGVGGGAPGFQSFLFDDSLYLASNGLPTGTSNQFFLFNGTTGAAATPATISVGPTNARPTMPDWAVNGKTVLFVLPQKTGAWTGTFGDSLKDDDHVFGGSIYSMSYDPATKAFGTPAPVLMSAGENNYYPGFSPDGQFIAFNRVDMQAVPNPIAGRPDCTGSGAQVTCPNDSFSNPKARVWLLSTKPGAKPLDAENANGSPAASPVDVSNSWPRWSPFKQTYKGDNLLWVTFSSTRDYGLRVRNHKSGMFQCYPADSLQQAGGQHGTAFDASCQQPQIWMAAINLSHLEFASTDPSFHAFWLPFQDVTTHNHTAQWTETVVDQPPPDMGACIPNGGDCTTNPNACCGGICTGTGVCGIP